ncbi:KTSC domain-containing protein [Sphingobium tyrosinilyticum]|uniref:KTSC domain-containing protein n=2 Tax=Sphingobium TaxID=165695 RepID=A0ABV9EXB7_9SPHN
MKPIRTGATVGTQESGERCFFMRACRFTNSSMIDRAAFDDDARMLTISFRQTGKYVYYDVPGIIFEELCKARSAGAFFNQEIKGRYPCRRDPARRRFGPNA